jgi:hypothetical protein
MQAPGLELTCLWYDTDILELRVCASNGAYSGCAKPYLDLHGLAELAARLEGFPRDASDVREVSLGAKGSEFAGGFISIMLFCRDSAGHAVLEFKAVSKNEPGTPDVPWNRTPESVHFYAQIEASAVDAFVEDLRKLDGTLNGTIVFPFAR